mmetsp:Transcript_20569/g.51790  ORF Transcript_20569/g.51790 Transcript_20569/m.51790 type:complete len:334 (-) Transcript_20569:650-1651(-)
MSPACEAPAAATVACMMLAPVFPGASTANRSCAILPPPPMGLMLISPTHLTAMYDSAAESASETQVCHTGIPNAKRMESTAPAPASRRPHFTTASGTWSGWSSFAAAAPLDVVRLAATSSASAKTSCVSAPTVSSVMPGQRMKPRAPVIAIAGPATSPADCTYGARSPHAPTAPRPIANAVYGPMSMPMLRSMGSSSTANPNCESRCPSGSWIELGIFGMKYFAMVNAAEARNQRRSTSALAVASWPDAYSALMVRNVVVPSGKGYAASTTIGLRSGTPSRHPRNAIERAKPMSVGAECGIPRRESAGMALVRPPAATMVPHAEAHVCEMFTS